MTLSEFKAWFEGFTENISGAPTDEQFDRIKARVAEIDGDPVTERVFIDRYLPRPWLNPVRDPYYPPWWPPQVWCSTGDPAPDHPIIEIPATWNSGWAMHELGRVEANT